MSTTMLGKEKRKTRLKSLLLVFYACANIYIYIETCFLFGGLALEADDLFCDLCVFSRRMDM